MTILSNDPMGIDKELLTFRSIAFEDNNIPQSYKNTVIFTFKKVILIDILVRSGWIESHSINTTMKNIIFDMMSAIISFVEKKERYFYLNMRSLVEHTARIDASYILPEFTIESGDYVHITTDIILKLEQAGDNNKWEYLRSLYKKSCQFIHGSSKSGMCLHSSFKSLKNGDADANFKVLINHLEKVSYLITKTLITHFYEELSNSMYRSTRFLKKLLGESLRKEWNSLLDNQYLL